MSALLKLTKVRASPVVTTTVYRPPREIPVVSRLRRPKGDQRGSLVAERMASGDRGASQPHGRPFVSSTATTSSSRVMWIHTGRSSARRDRVSRHAASVEADRSSSHACARAHFPHWRNVTMPGRLQRFAAIHRVGRFDGSAIPVMRRGPSLPRPSRTPPHLSARLAVPRRSERSCPSETRARLRALLE